MTDTGDARSDPEPLSVPIEAVQPSRLYLDAATYRQCVEWCRDEGVTEIADLTGRALNAEDFEEKWVARCQRFADE